MFKFNEQVMLHRKKKNGVYFIMMRFLFLLTFFYIFSCCTASSQYKKADIFFGNKLAIVNDLEFRSNGKYYSNIYGFDYQEKKFKSLVGVQFNATKFGDLSENTLVVAGECQLNIVNLKINTKKILKLCDSEAIEEILNIHVINSKIFVAEIRLHNGEKFINEIYLIDEDGNIIGRKILRYELLGIDSNFQSIGISDSGYTILDFEFNTKFKLDENGSIENFHISIFRDRIILQNVNDSFVKLYHAGNNSYPAFICNIEIPIFTEDDFFAIYRKVNTKLFILNYDGKICWLNLDESNLKSFYCDKINYAEPAIITQIPGDSKSKFIVLRKGKNRNSLIFYEFEITEGNKINELSSAVEIYFTK